MTSQRDRVAESGTGTVLRAAALAAGLTALGSLLGLLRDLSLARFFGATGETDAFLVAWTVPETASPLLIEGAMAFLMVPIFVRALAEQGTLGGVVRATLPRIAAPLALTAGAVAVAAPVLVHLLAPGLSEPAEAVRAMRVTAVTVLTFGLAGYLGAALRSAHVFGWPASIYIAYNVGILGSMALLHDKLGVFSAAVGVAAGSILMVGVQLPAFLRRVEPVAARVAGAAPQVALLAFIPIAVFTLTRHAQVFVERILGSQLPAGTISYLNYAQKVAQVPMVLSIMVAAVTFPMLARSVVAGDDTGSRQRMERDLRMVSAVVLVASAYLVTFSVPIIRLLFEHGAFTAQDTAATAAIMRVYALGLLGQAAVGVLTRSYFAHRRPTWYPALVMAAGLALTVVVSLALLPRWGGSGIAAGNAAGITLTAALLLRGQRARPGAVFVTGVSRSVGGLVLLAAAAGLAGWLVERLTAGLATVVTLTAGGVTVVATFLVLSVATAAVQQRRAARTPVGGLGSAGVLPETPMILMYHSIGRRDDDPYHITVSPQRFAEQMRWLQERGLRGTSVRELLDAAGNGGAAGLVGLTFDDGYADFLDHALPVLTRHGFTATVFVVAGKLGGHNDWDDEDPAKPLMTAEHVREAARSGIEIGSHGLDHRTLATVGADALQRQLERSREILESLLEVPVRGFCYPYGELPASAREAVRAAGYDYAAATWGSGRRDRYALPRTYVGERDGPLRLYAKQLRHRLVWRVGR
jgi:putative peptidoglycan lipid II flippase